MVVSSHTLLSKVLLSLVTIVIMLICVSFFTLVERKFLGAMQRRKGPNAIGVWGVLQPLADGLKLALTEVIVPAHAHKRLFIIAPLWTFVISFTAWAFIPFSYTDVLADVQYSLLYVFAFSSFGVYGLILAGWASQSRYPFLGAIRAAAQMISY